MEQDKKSHMIVTFVSMISWIIYLFYEILKEKLN